MDANKTLVLHKDHILLREGYEGQEGREGNTFPADHTDQHGSVRVSVTLLRSSSYAGQAISVHQWLPILGVLCDLGVKKRIYTKIASFFAKATKDRKAAKEIGFLEKRPWCKKYFYR
jgi:hypothetical protein